MFVSLARARVPGGPTSPPARLPDTLEHPPTADGARYRLSSLPLHPFLFCALFVVYLLAENLDDQPKLSDVLTMFGLAAGAAAAVMLLLALVLRSLSLAANLTSVGVLWVFLYQYADDVLAPAPEDRLRVLHWALIGIAALIVPVVLHRHSARLTQAMNFASGVLLAFNLIPVVPHQVATATAPMYRAPSVESLEGVPEEVAEDGRDIYYIILDRYPSQTTLMSTAYGYDNSPFLNALKEHGFYLAEDSRANYIMTALSVASSLNMQYLDADAMEAAAVRPSDWKPVYDMLAGSLAVPKLLEQQGYTYVQLPSWFAATAAGAEVDVRMQHEWLSEFGNVLLDTTVIPRVLRLAGIERGSTHANNALFQFDRLTKLDDVASPKFVFAHILLPHPPYVFDSEGPVPANERLLATNQTDRFLEQLEYTNRRVLEVVDHLLAGPDETDPIVIVQGDEGPRTPDRVSDWLRATQEQVQQKFGIVNALYFPGVDDPALYPSITPVNIFRVMFNEYFGANIPMLEDRVLAFGGGSIYNYVDITHRFAETSTDVDPQGVEYSASPPSSWVAGLAQTYDVTVTNAGDAPWRSTGDDATALYVQFVPAATDDQLGWSAGGHRVDLPRDVAPGETVTLQATVQAPDLGGTYRLRHRLAHGINWFAAGPQLDVTVSSSGEAWADALAASYRVRAADSWEAGETRTYEVTVTNTGTHAWNANGDTRVRLGVHFGGESDEPHVGWQTDLRADLPESVAPGDSVTVEVDVTAPDAPGSYVLRHRMVKERIGWFDELDARAVTVDVTEARAGGTEVPVLPIAVGAAVLLAVGGGYLALRRPWSTKRQPD